MAGFESLAASHRAYVVDGSRSIQGNDVVVAGGQTTNYPASGNKRLPEGAVVVKKTGDGKYYLADLSDGATYGDINTAAIVTSDQAGAAGWASKVFTWTFRSGSTRSSGTITAGGADDTTAEFVTLFNADAAFRSRAIASGSNGSPLVLTTLAKGDVELTITENVAAHAAFGGGTGSAAGTTAVGAVADTRVLAREVDTVDTSGNSRDSDPTLNLKAGRFLTTEMWGGSTATIPAESKANLIGAGSSFE